MSIINVEDIIYEYIKRDESGNVKSTVTALNGITADIEEGEFVAILGANGSGKSTFAKHLNALLTPTKGKVLVDSMDTEDEDHILDIRKTVGMVFQNPDNQIVAGVVEDDVAFGPENIGIPTMEIWTRVERGLRDVEMLEFRESSPERLSGGQKQRVAIAGVIAMMPKCIVFDESTSMLDPKGRKDVLDIMRKINKENNTTVVFITHNMEEVTDADRIIVIDKGNIVASGTPKAIFSRVEELEKLRLDVPLVTRLAYELKKSGVNIPDGLLTREELTKELLNYKRRK